MRRIALVCDWYAPRLGGIEAHLAGLGERLLQAGHEVHVITSTPGPVTSTGLRVHRLSSTRAPIANVVVHPGVVSEIQGLLRSNRIELLHSHVSIVAPVALGGAVAARNAGVPAVVTFHSFVPATPLWAWLAGRLLGADRWDAVMTAVSRRVVREVASFAPHHSFSVLPNAIDLDFWTPGDPIVRDGNLILTYAGRLHAKKNPMRVMKAVRALRRSFPALPFRLRICGSGSLEPAMRRFAAREGLLESTEFLGWQDASTLRDLLRSTDVFLAPADRESFGLAALEARAVGVPVVAMQASGVADFITDRQSGMLATSGGHFAAAVATVAGDRKLLESMRDHNRRVRPDRGWDSALRDHAEVYGRAFSGSPA
jgi:glycosyltransferase involved in cell wall biosynthesis